MNQYLKNLNRIEFVVTMACTGRCKHCSEGEHISDGEHIDGDAAAEAVCEICVDIQPVKIKRLQIPTIPAAIFFILTYTP